MPLACFLTPGRSLASALNRVKLAESLGYESVWVSHISGRDAFIVLAAYAAVTERIALGTGVVPIYGRAPAAMAQMAASLDELSDGRHRLGLGVSHRPVVEGWFGETIGKPVSEMREYAAIVRAILRGEPPPAGERWRTAFALGGGLGPRPDVPIYLAGLSPRMLELAGEVADGVVLWLCNPAYVERVVLPAVRRGRQAAGRPLEGFDIVAAVPCALTDDPGSVRAALRRELIPYFGLPFYRAMIERSGFADDVAAFDAAAGDMEGMTAAISDAFVDQLAGIGDAAAVKAAVERYAAAGVDSPAVGPIGRSDVEATLRAAAGAPHGPPAGPPDQ